MSSDPEWNIHIRRIESLRAAYTHSSSDTPEEDAWKKMEAWARPRGILTKEKGTRIFGRNTYPTDNPEPHGYQLFITVDQSIKPENEIKIGEIPGGTYAVLSSTNLDNIGDAWRSLWSWIENSEYEFIGWKKEEYGWADGYEEHLNPFDDKLISEWKFELWIPLKEKVYKPVDLETD